MKREARFGTTLYSMRDLWLKKDPGGARDALNAEVPAHDVLLLRLKKL